MNLRYGAAYVYRKGERLYAWGDFTHCPREDIEHNIRVLAQMLFVETGLTYIGKSYQADVYMHKEKVDWERVAKEVREVYRERFLEIGQEGTVVGAADSWPQSESSSGK